MSLTQFRTIAAVVLVAAPGVLTAQGKTPIAPTPALAVQEFMRAVADSNLTRMAELWGNAKGPAAATRFPKDYEKRIVIIQAMLHGVQSRTVGEVPATAPGMRSVTTQLSHNGCTVTLSVNAVKYRSGWLVHDFDLEQAGQVNQPCDTSHRPGNSTR